jgi:hypothetical protein
MLNLAFIYFYPLLDEIVAVQQATVQFIEDAAADEDQDFRYVLVPFNDPGGSLSHCITTIGRIILVYYCNCCDLI